MIGKYTAIDILSCTIEVDDRSVKQTDSSNNPHHFPRYGREYLLSWQSHMVYVEGGNTFFMEHCADKQDYVKDVTADCIGSKNAVYIASKNT